MTLQSYLECDMQDVACLELAGGKAAVYSFRCPGKETPNEDAAALIGIDHQSAVIVLADGMGGASAGQHAARIAVESLQDTVAAASGDGTLLRGAILNGIEKANQAIMALGVGAATTLAVVEIQSNEIRPYHVGDSEILLVGGQGKVKLQTVAHSPVGYAVEAGILGQDEAMLHAQRHVISNAVGSADMRIEIGSPVRMTVRDTLLLSSDGLTDNLLAAEIVARIRKGALPTAIRNLADDVRQRMSSLQPGLPCKPDDTTIVLYRAK